ncbi:MAG: hypothetical protein GC150_04545 [Rhizobiales bacterium]|nr:hypothetical protein [Hyphomicrobiales bacterium]
MYRRLDPNKIIQTLERLTLRIEERFAGAGLASVARELTDLAAQTSARAEKIKEPNWTLRLAVGLLMAIGLAVLIAVTNIIQVKRTTDDLFGVLQGIEAFFNVVVLMGAAAFFLATVERRVKRGRALRDLHGLRAIVHVIDMHQLTKDPGVLVEGEHRTAHSPARTMTPFELTRYLDYCSEMLSLTGKVAALYAQSLDDRAVTETVNEIEQLTTDLSRKIWQKIMIIHQRMPVVVETRHDADQAQGAADGAARATEITEPRIAERTEEL